MKKQIRGRFAPSPSGRMHLGNIFCALLAWLSVRSQDGTLLLRIEDLDPQRCSKEKARQLIDDLRWLGLDWDEGAEQSPFSEKYYQSNRFDIYAEYFEKLNSQGLVYPCYCSRAELHVAEAPHASDGRIIYAQTCKNLTEAERQTKAQKRNPAWRLALPDKEISFIDGHYGKTTANLANDWGDIIIRRSDGVYAYQLAVVVDDALMGVTEVVRGYDLLTSTAPQIHLHQLLGFTPPQFTHLPLLTDNQGRRLAKRDMDMDLDTLKQIHRGPEKIIGQLAYWANLIDKPEAITAQELVPLFDWNKIPTDNIVVK